MFVNPPAIDRRMLLRGLAATAALAITPLAHAAPFQSRRIAVTVRGHGPDVILIPGLASGASLWNATVAAVPGYRYHLVQVRGFAGLAPELNKSGPLIAPLVAEIARYISSSGLRRPAIVGHSMGGTLAMMLALRGVAGKLMVVDMLPEGAGMVGGTARGMGYLANQLSQYFTGTRAGREMFANILSQNPGAKGSDPHVIATALRELAHTDLGPSLPKIRAPFDIVYAVPSDARERAAQVQRYRTAYALAKAARLRPIGPAGHMVMADQPKAFAEAMRDFLKV